MASKNLFSQISKLNKFIINHNTFVPQQKENVFEFDKNDQLVSKYESEVRIVVILCVLSMLNISILATLIITISEAIKNELKIIPIEIPTLSKVPYLQAFTKRIPWQKEFQSWETWKRPDEGTLYSPITFWLSWI